jgi:hypothetical protein
MFPHVAASQPITGHMYRHMIFVAGTRCDLSRHMKQLCPDTVCRNICALVHTGLNESCLMYLDDMIMIWPHVPRSAAPPTESVQAVPRSLPKTQSSEVPTLSEGCVAPWAYCVTRGDNHRPRRIITKLVASWAYAHIRDE